MSEQINLLEKNETQAPCDPRSMHRWLATSLTNLAWDLSDERCPERDDELMVSAAHAARLHMQLGGALPSALQGAEHLLSHVCRKAGQMREAINHAERCLTVTQQNLDGLRAFDVANAHGCAALAYDGSRDEERAHRHRVAAKEAAARIEDPDLQWHFDRLYGTPQTT